MVLGSLGNIDIIIIVCITLKQQQQHNQKHTLAYST